METNIHDGHRERVRKEFLLNGFSEKTPEHQVLEALLFYGIPRKDTNPIAHILLKKFGSIKNVLDASVSDLTLIDGISENAAVLLKMIIPVARIYGCQHNSKCDFDSFEAIGNFIRNRYFGLSNEQLSILGINNKGKKMFFEFVSEGDTASVGVSIRDIIKASIDGKASSVVLAHNHPGGVALPSREDIAITTEVAKALKYVHIRLLDHIILSDGDYVSLRQSEEYKDIFDL